MRPIGLSNTDHSLACRKQSIMQVEESVLSAFAWSGVITLASTGSSLVFLNALRIKAQAPPWRLIGPVVLLATSLLPSDSVPAPSPSSSWAPGHWSGRHIDTEPVSLQLARPSIALREAFGLIGCCESSAKRRNSSTFRVAPWVPPATCGNNQSVASA